MDDTPGIGQAELLCRLRIVGLSLQRRDSDSIGPVVPKVSAETGVHCPRVKSIAPTTDETSIRPEFQQHTLQRRHPTQLHALDPLLATEKGLVDQWCVNKVPRMLMNFVQISEAGKEAPSLEVEAIAQRRRLHDGLFG